MLAEDNLAMPFQCEFTQLAYESDIKSIFVHQRTQEDGHYTEKILQTMNS